MAFPDWLTFSSKKKIDEEFVRKSKTFCMMPWVHLHINQAGNVSACCQMPWEGETTFGNIAWQQIDEIWNDKPIRSFRKKLMKDQPAKGCERCYHKESVGLLSLRQITNNDYLHKLDWVKGTKSNGIAADAKPIYWDIRFSNLCNLRCRICGPWSSSRWYEDAKALGFSTGAQRVVSAIKDYDTLLNQLEPVVQDLEEIYFAGGEPLIMAEHYKLLDFLLAKGKQDLRLKYNTNFSVLGYKDRKVTDLWAQFREVIIAASLDGSGKRGEFQRKDLVWEEVLRNREQLRKDAPNVYFMISPTVSVFNVWHLPDFHRELTESGFITVNDLFPSLLDNPKAYNIKIIPEELKAGLVEKYTQHIDWIDSQEVEDEEHKAKVMREFEHCVEFMLADDWTDQLPEFRERCKALDNLRGESTLEVFPELGPLLK